MREIKFKVWDKIIILEDIYTRWYKYIYEEDE